MGLRICLAPNEDGLGTSAWTVRLVKELLRQGGARIELVEVVTASRSLAEFHADKYGDPRVQIVRLEEVRYPLRLVKKRGGVDVAATLARLRRHYQASRRAYLEALRARGILSRAHLAVELGVPQVGAALWEENRRRLGAGQPRLQSTTVCDHAWHHTLRQMARAAGLLSGPLAAVLERMRCDGTRSGATHLFPEPITPAGYERHWERRPLRLPVRRLRGVLGGPRAAQAWAGGPARAAVRSLLGIEDDLPVLYVSGGGTAVWDKLLTGLVNDYLRRPPRYHVALFCPAEAQRRGIRMSLRRVGSCALEAGLHPACPQLTFLGRVPGETHHVLFAGFDAALTRAGGGTVNDAVAFRVPLVLIEEKNHWQVEQIRRACRRMGLCRSATLEQFRRRGRALWETPQGELLDLGEERRAMRAIPNHAEVALVRDWLRNLGGLGPLQAGVCALAGLRSC